MNEIQSDRPMQVKPMSVQIITENKPPAQKKIDQAFMDIRINADDQSSCKTTAYWAIILAATIIVSLTAGFALPQSILQVNRGASLSGTNLEGCNNNLLSRGSGIFCGPYYSPLTAGQYVNGVSLLNQFVTFYLTVNLNSRTILFDQNLSFKLFKAQKITHSNGVSVLTLGDQLMSKDVNLQSNYYGQQRFYLEYVNKLSEGDQFYWQIDFSTDSKIKNYSYSLHSFTVNPAYTQFCIAIRFIFLIISAIFCLIYGRHFQSLVGYRILPEQKIIMFLGFATLGFNDPLYFITVLYPTPFMTIVSTLSIWTFMTALIFVWVFFLVRIKHEPGEVQTQKGTKGNIALFVVFYLVNIIYRISLALYQTTNRPLTDPAETDSIFVSIMFFLSTMSFLAVLVYILTLYCDLCNQPTLMWRHKVFVNVSFFFYLFLFGIFMVDGFDVFQYSASQVIFTFTFMNIFSFYLQYMYMGSSHNKVIKPREAVVSQQKVNQKFQIQASALGDDNLDHFVIMYDEVEVDLQKNDDYLVEFSDMDQKEPKPGFSYLGQNLHQKHPSYLVPQNDQILASKIDSEEVGSKHSSSIEPQVLNLSAENAQE